MVKKVQIPKQKGSIFFISDINNVELIKRARERWLVRNTRARVGFADGSLKVLEKV
jgi:hypothetical protein